MIKKILNILIIPVVAISLNSCLDMESDAELNSDSSGELLLDYSIPLETELIKPGKELTGFRIVPYEEPAFRAAVEAQEGLSLLDLQIEENVFSIDITARLGFSSTEAIESFFNTESGKELISIDFNGVSQFSMVINNFWDAGIDNTTMELIEKLYPDNEIKLKLLLPGIVTSSESGALADNPAEVRFSFNVADFMKSGQTVTWSAEFTNE